MWWCCIGFVSLIRVCNNLMDQTSFPSMYFGWYEKDRHLTHWQSLSACGLEVLGLNQHFCKIKQGLRLSRNFLLIPPSDGAFSTRYALISYHFGWYEIILAEFNSLGWHIWIVDKPNMGMGICSIHHFSFWLRWEWVMLAFQHYDFMVIGKVPRYWNWYLPSYNWCLVASLGTSPRRIQKLFQLSQ